MPGLEPTASDVLQALGAARTPEAGATERAWLQMQQRIVDGPPPMDVGPVVAVAERPRWIAVALATTAIAAAAALVFAWGSQGATDLDDAAVQSAPYSSASPAPEPEPSPPSPTVTTEPAPSAVASSVAPVDDAPSVAPRPEPATARPRTPAKRPESPVKRPESPATPVPATPKTTTLAAEMTLLAQANAAMRRGDAAAALATLDEHRRRFADGQLAPERDVARAVALCELGRREAARAVADAFARAHPSSALRTKAEGVCRD